jgi:hypothetical protein
MPLHMSDPMPPEVAGVVSDPTTAMVLLPITMPEEPAPGVYVSVPTTIREEEGARLMGVPSTVMAEAPAESVCPFTIIGAAEVVTAARVIVRLPDVIVVGLAPSV